MIENAQSAQRQPVFIGQQGSGIKAKIGILCNQGVVGKSWIFAGVFHNEQVGLKYGVGADGNIQRCFSNVQTLYRLEPLAVTVNEVDHGDGGFADDGNQLNNIVEIGFFDRVQHAVAFK